MPLLRLQISENISPEKKNALLSTLSGTMAETLSKPEVFVMIIIEQADIFMSGKKEPAAFADIKSIGSINPSTTASLANKLTTILNRELGIAKDRFYINFTDVPAEHWGWNAATFG